MPIRVSDGRGNHASLSGLPYAHAIARRSSLGCCGPRSPQDNRLRRAPCSCGWFQRWRESHAAWTVTVRRVAPGQSPREPARASCRASRACCPPTRPRLPQTSLRLSKLSTISRHSCHAGSGSARTGRLVQCGRQTVHADDRRMTKSSDTTVSLS